MEEALDSPNGSVNLLARSLRDVIAESQTVVLDAMKSELDALQNAVADDMKAMEGRLNEHINKQINTVNENMQAQFGVVHEKFAGVDRTMTTMDKKLGKMSNRLSELDGR